MKEYETSGIVKDGKLSLRNQARFLEAFKGWPDGEVIVTVRRPYATRSLNQNAFYWGVIIEHIAAHTGYTPEETHEALKTMFLPKKLAMLDGNGDVHGELVIGGSTTLLNKIEFGEYCTRIREWALSHLGVDIPSPESAAA